MAIRIAINGMGVLGRELFRMLFDKIEEHTVEIVLLNDPYITPANLAYLLQYDSIYHAWDDKEISSNESSITVDGKCFSLYREHIISNVPWGSIGVDLVLECTQTMNDKAALQSFINSGAKKVIACYPAGDAPMYAYNVNDDNVSKTEQCISMSSMSTQVSARLLAGLQSRGHKIQYAYINNYRAYSNSQSAMDSADEDAFQIGRAAAGNITPAYSNFAKAVTKLLPDLTTNILGINYRSPVINGSVINAVVGIDGVHTKESINEDIKASDKLFYSETPLCSSDALGNLKPIYLSKAIQTISVNDTSTVVNMSILYDNIRGFCYLIDRFIQKQSGVNGWLS